MSNKIISFDDLFLLHCIKGNISVELGGFNGDFGSLVIVIMVVYALGVSLPKFLITFTSISLLKTLFLISFLMKPSLKTLNNSKSLENNGCEKMRKKRWIRNLLKILKILSKLET